MTLPSFGFAVVHPDGLCPGGMQWLANGYCYCRVAARLTPLVVVDFQLSRFGSSLPQENQMCFVFSCVNANKRPLNSSMGGLFVTCEESRAVGVVAVREGPWQAQGDWVTEPRAYVSGVHGPMTPERGWGLGWAVRRRKVLEGRVLCSFSHVLNCRNIAWLPTPSYFFGSFLF